MASYNGRLNHDPGEVPGPFSPAPLDTFTPLVDEVLRGEHSRGTPGRVGGRSFTGRISEGLEEILLDRVYYSPLAIDAGIIADASDHDIFIWNANRTPVSITQIQVVPASGVTIIPDSVPQIISAGNDTTVVVRVEKIGPPVQNSSVIFTIESENYTTTVKGRRIVLFEFEPDGGDGITMNYAFNTKRYQNSFFVEQRGPRWEKLMRVIKQTFIEEDEVARHLVNEVRNKANILVGVPLYVEPLFMSGDLQGGTVLAPDNSDELQYFFNWQRLTDICVLVSDDGIESEIKTVASVSDDIVTLQSPVVNAFLDGVECRAYPIMLAVLEDFDGEVIHNEAIQATLTQVETRPDGG